MTAPAEAIRRYCAAHAGSVLWDEPSATLRDVASGKTLALDLSRLREVASRRAQGGDEEYLLLAFEDGRQLALATAGIAFPPDFRNSGRLEGMPQVVCWRDFASVAGVIEHSLSLHPEAAPGRELLDMIRYCIALLDGARAAGFEVGEEERRIERSLATIERRAGGRPA